MHNFPEEDLNQEEVPKTQNEDIFIPNLVHFLIHIILIGGMTHYHISPASPSYSMHI